MEKFAINLAHRISLAINCDEEKEAVIAYGLIALIQITVTVLLVLLFGLLVGAPAEAMVVCFSGSILRKYSGGAHAKTAELCTFISVVYCTSMAYFSKSILAPLYNPFFMSIAIILLFGLSLFIIYKYAPVDSPEKPIKTEKKKKRMRKGSFITLFTFFIISIILFTTSEKYEASKSYGLSLLLGIVWQTFTLTAFGKIFLNKVNTIFAFERR